MPKKFKKATKKSQENARKDAFVKLGIIFVGIVLVANTIQLTQFGSIVERVDIYNKGIIDEFGEFREDIVSFGTDMNEMRSYLLLPTKQYSFMEDSPGEEKHSASEEVSKTEQALYKFISQFADERTMAENAAMAEKRMEDLTKNEDFKAGLEEYELKLTRLETNEFSSTVKVMAGSEAVFAIAVDKSTNQMQVQSSLGSEDIEADSAAEVESLLSYIGKHKEDALEMKEIISNAKKEITDFAANRDTKSILKEKKMAFDDAPVEDDETISYNFLNSEGAPIITVAVVRHDGTFRIGEESHNDSTAFIDALTQIIQDVDAGTELEKMINERRSELEKIFAEEAFQEVLAHNGLAVEQEPREDYNKLLYDVKNETGDTQFSFVIEMSSGAFKILREDEEIDLTTLLIGSKKNF